MARWNGKPDLTPIQIPEREVINLTEKSQAAKVYNLWLKLRKRTVVAHWLLGILCAVIAVLFFPAGICLLVIFAGFEAWNDWCNNKNVTGCINKWEGAEDWWDSFLTFCIVFTVAVILHIIGIISIRWY